MAEPVLEPCTPAWYERVEREVHVGDAEGHGPDLGSVEWMSVVEKRLGLYEQADFPEPGTPAWCDRIDERLGLRDREYAKAQRAAETL